MKKICYRSKIFHDQYVTSNNYTNPHIRYVGKIEGYLMSCWKQQHMQQNIVITMCTCTPICA